MHRFEKYYYSSLLGFTKYRRDGET